MPLPTMGRVLSLRTFYNPYNELEKGTIMLTFVTIIAVFAVVIGAVVGMSGSWEHPETL
nr:MAG TPA: hypothetical protein [Caudoviricetes sp.]